MKFASSFKLCLHSDSVAQRGLWPTRTKQGDNCEQGKWDASDNGADTSKDWVEEEVGYSKARGQKKYGGKSRLSNPTRSDPTQQQLPK